MLKFELRHYKKPVTTPSYNTSSPQDSYFCIRQPFRLKIVIKGGGKKKLTLGQVP